jgi:serine/threonine protein kinase
MPFLLKVIAGPDQGRSFPLPANGALTVGRGADSILTDSRVSSSHIRLTTAGGQVRLLDLGSKSGALVNNEPVTAEQVLRPGDVIRVGDTWLELVSDSTAKQPTPPPTGAPRGPVAIPRPGSAPVVPARAAAPPPAPPRGEKRRQVAERDAGERQANPSTKENANADSKGQVETPRAGGPTILPALFGPYRVKKLLGGGGMGAVYLVENTRLEREEALKAPHLDTDSDPEVKKRFLIEARAAAKLDHPNLCQVYDADEIDGQLFMTMRYLKGRPLSDYAGAPQPPRKVAEIVFKLAQALEHAHSRGIVHRDLKPSNVMMCLGAGPTVMDFGLARQTKQLHTRLTQSGTMLGTPAYMPPEQVKGQLDKMGPASDVYSLGVTLFELLTGRLPFEGAVAEILGKILYTEAPLPSRLKPDLHPDLDEICRKAMAREPGQRYPTMKAFAAALTDYLKATPAREGAGNLIVKGAARPLGRPAPAREPQTPNIFQAPTVAPAPANDSRRKILNAATVAPGKQVVNAETQVGGKAPSGAFDSTDAPVPVTLVETDSAERSESARKSKRRRDLGKVNIGLAIHYGGMVAFLVGQAAAWLGLFLLVIALVSLGARNKPDAASGGPLVISGILFLGAWGLTSCSSLADVFSSAFCLLAPDATARGWLAASLVVRLLALPAGCVFVVFGLPALAVLASTMLALAGWGFWMAFLRALAKSLKQPKLGSEAVSIIGAAVKFVAGWVAAIGLAVVFLAIMVKFGGCVVAVLAVVLIFATAGFIRALILSDRVESLSLLVLAPTGIPLTMRYLDLIGALRMIILRRS